MQICRYLPVKESCFSALLGHYTTFGLRAETETERGWLPLLTLSDVSCDEEFDFVRYVDPGQRTAAGYL